MSLKSINLLFLRMQSKKLLFILTAWTICLQVLSAQQVYQAIHYGEPGDIYLYNRVNSLMINDEITKSGAGVTWDIGSAAGLSTHANRILQPGEGINQFNFLSVCTLGGFSTGDCFAVWNSTDQAVQLKDTLLLLDFILYDLQHYQAKVSNLLLENFIGFTVDLGGTPTQAVIVYQVPDTIMHFPVAYGDNWTSETRYGLDLNPAGQNIIYNAIQTRITTIDGWGTLQTPYDTFENVVRLRSDILRLDTIVQDDTDTITILADQVEYMWLDTNYTLPIMTANGLITSNDSVVINQVEYIYEETCPAPTWTVDAGSNVFYLDTSGTVNIDFNVLNANADTYDWDFGDGQLGNSQGSISHLYTSPGEYNAVVIGCMTNCLPLNSCSFQIIDFEIVDTTTSMLVVDGIDLGIRMYPNPVRESLTLVTPTDLKMDHYRIMDVTGRTVQTGALDTETSNIVCDELSGGVYTLQMWTGSSAVMQMAVMRFMMMD